jgi:hypothetical protein
MVPKIIRRDHSIPELEVLLVRPRPVRCPEFKSRGRTTLAMQQNGLHSGGMRPNLPRADTGGKLDHLIDNTLLGNDFRVDCQIGSLVERLPRRQ